MSGWPSKSVDFIISAFPSSCQPNSGQGEGSRTPSALLYFATYMLPETTYPVNGLICYGFVTK